MKKSIIKESLKTKSNKQKENHVNKIEEKKWCKIYLLREITM